MTRLRHALRLRRPDDCRDAALRALVSRTSEHASCFVLRCDEGLFARRLLRASTHLWLFRANQRLFCGDFVVVDMSSPVVDRRRAFAIELKLGGRLRLGGDGHQQRNVARAIAEIAARRGIVRRDCEPVRLIGDRRAILEFLGVAAPPVGVQAAA